MAHQPQVTHVLSDVLLTKMISSLSKVGYLWTRIGVEEVKGKERIKDLQGQLIQVMDEFVADQEREYSLQRTQIQRLESQIELVLKDLSVLLGKDELTTLMARPSGAQHLNSCLSVQRAYLRKLHRNLQILRSTKMEYFEELKSKLKSILEQLGLTEKVNSHCTAILVKQVANHEEIEVLVECIDVYQAILKQRQTIWKEMSHKVACLLRLVPLQIEEDHFLNDPQDSTDSQESCIILSEDNLAKLKQFHDDVHQSSLHIWHQISDTFSSLRKLYELFQVISELRHPYFGLLASLPPVGSDVLDTPLCQLFTEHSITLTVVLQELEEECQHYRTLKRERIGELLSAVRRQIADQLGKCLISMQSLVSDGRYQFLFLTDTLDDTVLCQHEDELQRVRAYYQKHEHIFVQVGRWRQLSEELRNCEQQLQSSLQKNRGGVLQKILNKQRLTKKQLTQAGQQINMWLNEQHNRPGESSEGGPPFEQYGLQVDDIAREVGTALGVPPSARQLQTTRSPAKSIALTPSLTPRAGKSKPMSIKTKLFQSGPLKTNSQLDRARYGRHH